MRRIRDTLSSLSWLRESSLRLLCLQRQRRRKSPASLINKSLSQHQKNPEATSTRAAGQRRHYLIQGAAIWCALLGWNPPLVVAVGGIWRMDEEHLSLSSVLSSLKQEILFDSYKRGHSRCCRCHPLLDLWLFESDHLCAAREERLARRA